MFELQKDIGLFSPISRALLLLQASLAQSAESVTFNHVVASSSLARGDIVFGIVFGVSDFDADTVLAQQLGSSESSAGAHVACVYNSKACRVHVI